MRLWSQSASTAQLPVVAPLIAVPAHVTVDRLLIGTVTYALLGLFPALIVCEHHARMFYPSRSLCR